MFKPYFVMLNCSKGGITPMMEDECEIATYDTAEVAADAAELNPLGAHFGFEVFEVGNGEIYYTEEDY